MVHLRASMGTGLVGGGGRVACPSWQTGGKEVNMDGGTVLRKDSGRILMEA